MMEPALIIIYLCIGLLAGFMSGVFGIGGGTVRIPLLNLAGIPLIAAFGINLFVIPFSSLVGAASHRKNIDKKISVYVIIGGTAGSVIGAFSVGFITPLLLAVIFVVACIITLFGLHLERIAPAFARNVNPEAKTVISFSFILNLMTGMRGGSGGSLFPPLLKAMRLDVHRAIATSLFVTIFTAVAATAIYWQRGNIIWIPALCVLLGSMAGAGIGSKIALKTKPSWLEVGLSVLVVMLALITVYKAI